MATSPILFTGQKFFDERGSFQEVYSRLTHQVIPTIEQINCSVSSKGVLRGLHLQPGQGKLVSCVKGVVLDLVVNIHTLEHWVYELSEKNNSSVWIPGKDLAHGFFSLENDSVVVYGVTSGWNKEKEISIQAIDKDLKLLYYLGTSSLIQSEKDKNALTLTQLKKKGVI